MQTIYFAEQTIFYASSTSTNNKKNQMWNCAVAADKLSQFHARNDSVLCVRFLFL